MITYETDRLRLRPFCHEDLDLIFRLYSDPEILRYTPFDVMSKATAELHLARIIQDWEQVPQQSFEFAMIRKDAGEPVGRCHILIDPATDTGMIGWLLLKEHWGQNYAFESGEALIHCCLKHWGFTESMRSAIRRTWLHAESWSGSAFVLRHITGKNADIRKMG